MNDKYLIEVDLEPQNYGGSPKYFWCIKKTKDSLSINKGHGWNDTVPDSFNKAYKYYKTHIAKE